MEPRTPSILPEPRPIYFPLTSGDVEAVKTWNGIGVYPALHTSSRQVLCSWKCFLKSVQAIFAMQSVSQICYSSCKALYPKLQGLYYCISLTTSPSNLRNTIVICTTKNGNYTPSHLISEMVKSEKICILKTDEIQ